MQKLAFGFEDLKYLRLIAHHLKFSLYPDENPVLLIKWGINCYHYNLHNSENCNLIYAGQQRA